MTQNFAPQNCNSHFLTHVCRGAAMYAGLSLLNGSHWMNESFVWMGSLNKWIFCLIGIIGWMSHWWIGALVEWVIGEWDHWLNESLLDVSHGMNGVIAWMSQWWMGYWFYQSLVNGGHWMNRGIGWMSHWWMWSLNEWVIDEWGSLKEWVISEWGHWLNESLVNVIIEWMSHWWMGVIEWMSHWWMGALAEWISFLVQLII